MTPVLRTLRAAWRLAKCGVHIGSGVVRCAVIYPFIEPHQRLVQTGRWCAKMARVLGMQIHGSGVSHSGPVLLVANHISWLDILAINAVHPARFVSKSDVRAWPLLGWLVAGGGTLFIERERKRDALRVVHQIAEALKQGDTIAMFPEGTTGDGRSLLPFHANLMQAAVATSTPLQPIVLRYVDADVQPSRAVVWVGDTTLATSLWQVASADRLQVFVTQLSTVTTHGRDRRELAEQVRGQIAAALGLEASSLTKH
ncbi:MAG: lysophospholipid acyltransferase family protein [Rhizobacter sp.]